MLPLMAEPYQSDLYCSVEIRVGGRIFAQEIYNKRQLIDVNKSYFLE